MIYYQKKGKGPAVVLLHGLPCNHTIWDTLTEKLSDQYSFILPDFPGAGNSPESEKEITLNKIAEELAAILQKEKISSAVIAGHSMGGYTAMAFARNFPEKTKAISLIHSSTAADTEEKKQNRLKSIALIEKGEDAKKVFVKALIRNLFAPEFSRQHPEAIADAIQMGNLLSAKTLVQFYKALMNRDDNSSLLDGSDRFPPIQWILGDKDNATNLETTLPLTHLARFNDVCIYPGCGHMSMIEAPEKLVCDLNRFWQYVYH